MELEALSSKYTVDHSHINAEDKIISLFEPDTAQYLETLMSQRKTKKDKSCSTMRRNGS